MPVMIHQALKRVLLQTMAGSGSQPGARVKLLEDRHHLLQKLQGEGLGQETLSAQLSHHVERIHSDLARPELVSAPAPLQPGRTALLALRSYPHRLCQSAADVVLSGALQCSLQSWCMR